MDIIAKNSQTPKSNDEYKFWRQWTYEMAVLTRRWGKSLKAERRHLSSGLKGSWVITGPYAAVKDFKDHAVDAARHLGFHGGHEMSVQFFLDHMQGDHIISTPGQRRREQDREAKVRLSDGTLEVFRGRQRLG